MLQGNWIQKEENLKNQSQDTLNQSITGGGHYKEKDSNSTSKYKE